MSDIIGLWLNNIPGAILENNNSVRELSGVILQGYRAQEMSVAGSALLITMLRGHGLPGTDLKIVANDLKNFLDEKQFSDEKFNAITLKSYRDFDKWEATKEQIIAAAEKSSEEGWESMPLEQWSVDDTLHWLSDNNLAKYRCAFKKNDMDGQNLMWVNETDLRELGISSIGHRKTFMRLLTEAKKIRNSNKQIVSGVTPPQAVHETASKSGLGFEQSKGRSWDSVIVYGLSEALLDDEDTLFDIENFAFVGLSKKSLRATNDGIIFSFENPLKVDEKDELQAKFLEVIKRLGLDSYIEGPLKVEFWDDRDLSSESIKVEDEESNIPDNGWEQKVATPSPSPPKRMNYWKQFWIKLVTNGDAEDFFEDEYSKLKVRGAREVLATIRDVKLKEVSKDDPGIKHLKGFSQTQIEENLSNCPLDVMYEIENKKTEVDILKEDSPLPHATVAYTGMSVEGLPRMITDDDSTVHSIQNIVFKDVAVQRLVILNDKEPPALRIEFKQIITEENIPQLVRSLKNFLNAQNVDQKALGDVTIAFLEQGWEPMTAPVRTEKGLGHKRNRTDEFLVAPGDSVQMTRTFLIEGIPEIYLNKNGFLEDMPKGVFERLPLENINIPPARRQPDGSISQTTIEIRFKEALDMQQLPKIAMKLKQYLKWKQVPPRTMNEVTLQVSHEEKALPQEDLGANPIVGLIFNGIPKKILESNDLLYKMEKIVFSTKHPILLMEPNEKEQILRISLEKPIYNQEDLTMIAQKLKKFLTSQRISSSAINKVVVRNFKKEMWQQDPSVYQPTFNANEYIGIDIENMPAAIIDSDEQLEEIERKVLAKQRVIHMNVLDTTLKVSFGVAANGKAIETLARELKQFLSQRKVPIKQINNIVIAPYTKETWN